MLKRTLPTIFLVALACAPAADAAPRAHTAAEQRAEEALHETEQLLNGRGVRTGRELTLSLRELSTRLRHLRGDERERAVALLSRPTDADAPADERYTVPELPPLCDATFCVHSVGSGADAPSAGMAALALAEANAVRGFENGTLGWREPPSDGDAQVDIYLKDVGADRLFGFAATDPGQNTLSQHSYLVIDNDFDPAQYGGAPTLESLRVTLAHEYGHVLQYGYDVTADGWHYESSAVWLEQRMHPAIQDWLRFMNDSSRGGGWRSLTEVPLTYFEPDPDNPGAVDPRTAKVYGDVVWNHFLSSKYGGAGDAVQLGSWANSNGLEAPSTTAYDRAIRAVGGDGFATDFAEFSAAVSEWRVPNAPFFSPADLPDVERRGTLTVGGAAVTVPMDHLTFAFYDVPQTAGPLRFAAAFPAGMSAAIALVARSGAIDGGQVTTKLLELPDGGSGGVTIDEPTSFYNSGGRITAVLVNSDTSHGNWSPTTGDWRWLREDQRVTARVSSDPAAPAVAARTPAPGAKRVSTRRAITVRFSEPVAHVDESSFVVRGPKGGKVRGQVTYAGATRTATFRPAKQLSDTSSYTVHLGGGIVDAAGNPLGKVDWSFKTVRRAPRAKLRGFRLRSRDNDPLRFRATLSQDGRTVGRRKGTIKPGATRRLRIGGGEAGPAKIVVKLTDPQGNKKRLTRSLRLAG